MTRAEATSLAISVDKPRMATRRADGAGMASGRPTSGDDVARRILTLSPERIALLRTCLDALADAEAMADPAAVKYFRAGVAEVFRKPKAMPAKVTLRQRRARTA